MTLPSVLVAHTARASRAVLALATLAVATHAQQVHGAADKSAPAAPLVPPMLLEKTALEAGNPLATYAAMVALAEGYRASPLAPVYAEVRCNFEEWLGRPRAGLEAMALPALRQTWPGADAELPSAYRARDAVALIAERAARTQLVIYGEEHHLPQTRSVFEPLLRALHAAGYRYLAAETFADAVMQEDFARPDYRSGFYLRDPVFAAAVRLAQQLGYRLVAYDTVTAGPPGEPGFRDRTQAENLQRRVLDRDPDAKLLVIAGRGHAAEEPAQDGWEPMASVLKRRTGIDPLTIYAPTMSERASPAQEHPLYRAATAAGLITQPVILTDPDSGELLGTDAFDAYLFWPRVELVDGRPDWMVKVMGRQRVPLPETLRKGTGLRLVQAFDEGASVATIPTDQVLLDDDTEPPALMLPQGAFDLRVVDRASKVLAEERVVVPAR